MASAPTALLVAAVPELEAEAAPPIPDLAQVSTGRNIRVTVRAQGPVSGIAGNDPMNAALLDILGGWGDLSPEDLKRLELFRPERLAAAIAAVELPKSKSGEAKARLSQLRQYSADLERRSMTAQAAATQPVVPLVPEAAPAPRTGIAATPVTLTDTAAHTTAERAAVATPSTGATAGLAAAIALGTAWHTTPESSAESLAETGPETAAVVADAATDTYRLGADKLTSFWAEPRPLWKTDTEVSYQELPAPIFQEVEVGLSGNGVEVEREELYPPLAAVPAVDIAQSSAPPTTCAADQRRHFLLGRSARRP